MKDKEQLDRPLITQEEFNRILSATIGGAVLGAALADSIGAIVGGMAGFLSAYMSVKNK